MILAFAKMQALGNDFVVVDATRAPVPLTAERVRRLADRRRGVGCDQVLLAEPPTRPDADFRYRIFNADGGEVGQCGNGARCLARYLRLHGRTGSDRVRLETAGGILTAEIEPDGTVTVDMGVPRLEPAEVPLDAPRRAARYAFDTPRGPVEAAAVSMGNPHLVLRVADVARAPVAELGPALERHPRLPEGANVGFLEVVDRRRARLRVHERGVGAETPACGSGACAAVVAGRLWGELDEEVEVALPGGSLVLKWSGEGEPVRMRGPAEEVYEGRIAL